MKRQLRAGWQEFTRQRYLPSQIVDRSSVYSSAAELVRSHNNLVNTRERIGSLTVRASQTEIGPLNRLALDISRVLTVPELAVRFVQEKIALNGFAEALVNKNLATVEKTQTWTGPEVVLQPAYQYGPIVGHQAMVQHAVQLQGLGQAWVQQNGNWPVA